MAYEVDFCEEVRPIFFALKSELLRTRMAYYVFIHGAGKMTSAARQCNKRNLESLEEAFLNAHFFGSFPQFLSFLMFLIGYL